MKLAAPLLSAALALLAPAAVLAQGKPLVYCADASPEGFDPGMWDSASTNIVSAQMFDGLLGFKRPTTELTPKLALSYEISPDAKSFIFKLRPGVKFHSTPWFKPTRTLNADDVVVTFTRFIDPSLPFNKAFPTNFVYPQNLGLAKLIDGIDKVDDMTVRFRLKQPNVTFVANVAFAWAGIQSAEYAAQLLKDGKASQINVQPVGTGPFQFKSYAKDDVLRMTANPDYWGGKQPTTNLVFSISREPNVRVQKIAAGECHVTAALRDVDVGTLANNPNISIEKIQALNISYLSFNLKKPPTDKREVREALGHRHRPRRHLQGAVPARRRDAGRQRLPAVHPRLQQEAEERVRPHQGQGPAGQGRLPQRLRDRPVGAARAAPHQPQRPADGPAHPAGLGQDRRERPTSRPSNGASTSSAPTTASTTST